MVYVASMPDRPTAEALLISSSLNTGESLVGYRLVPSMFLGYQAEYRWLVNYENRYGKQPSWGAFLEKFSAFPRTDVTDTAYFADDVLYQYDTRCLRKAVKDAANHVYEGSLTEARESIASYQPTYGATPRADKLRDPEKYLIGYEEPIESINVPWKTIQDHTGGMRKGDLWVVAARLGMGKSWTLHNMIAQALMEGHDVMLYSLEMASAQVETRMHVVLGGLLGIPVNHWDMRDRRMPIREYRRLLGEISERVPGKLAIHDASNGPTNPLVVRETAPDYAMTVIDYIGLMKPSVGSKTSDEWRVVAGISNALKETAVATGTSILIASQINRDGATAKYPPKMHQLAQSDSIGQDADVAIMHTQYARSAMAYCLEKNRHGGAGYLFFTHFLPNSGEFNEISREKADDIRDNEEDRA